MQQIILLFAGQAASNKILLTLNNNRPQQLTTSLTLYTMDGERIALPSLTLDAAESRLIDFSHTLATHKINEQLGYLELNYSGQLAELGSQLTLYPVLDSGGLDSPRTLSQISLLQIGTPQHGSHTANAAGTSVITVMYTVDETQATATQTITVEACPATLTRAQSFTEPLAPLVPHILTGVGIIAQMQVGPSTIDWDITPIIESVTPSSSSCPAVFASCSGSSTFYVGDNDGGADSDDGVPTPATKNAFYDNHTFLSNVNVLAANKVPSCQLTCTQTYSCRGTQIGPTFTITYSFNPGTVGSTAVTTVNAQKTP